MGVKVRLRFLGVAAVVAQRDPHPSPERWALDPGAGPGHPRYMLIYKIFRTDEWAAFQAAGSTRGAPIDLTDGYIHFSTADQARETAAKHFAGEDGLFLVAVPVDGLGDDLKWEISRGGAEFPHLYRVLDMDDVAWVRPLPLSGDAHEFPDDMV